MTREEKVLAFINCEMKFPLKPEEIAVMLAVPQDDMAEFNMLLFALLEDSLIIETKRGKIASCAMMNLVNGKFTGNERGFGFVTADDGDVFIAPDKINGALHGDVVLAKILTDGSDDKRKEGEIIKIVKDTEQKIVGRFSKTGDNGFITPIFSKFNRDFFVKSKNINDAQNDDLVVAKLIKRAIDSKNPEAKIVATLGNKSEPGVDILSVLESQNIRYEFPAKVIEKTKSVPSEIDEKEIVKRLDLTNDTIITIDGDDAKDLDDAVCVKKLPDGTYELGVHIADVSHYVKEGGDFDKEAYARGTSIYLADRVVPMLPEILSNGICSLNEGVLRLTLSVIMKIDKDGNVIDHKIAESVIKSSARMTYKNITRILNNDADICVKYADLVEHIRAMNELREILSNKREARGSINFDFDEARIILDASGAPVDIQKREREVSNNIIEEFMLLANETIAEHFYWLGVPFVYRVHEEPEPDTMREFARFIAPFGYSIKHQGGKVHPKELAKLIKKLSGKKEEMIISTVMLRSLMKARYTDENLGHFGLSSKYYCHFTSPIRRYPDLLIHRIIKASIKGELNEEKYKKIVRKVSEHSSEKELSAIEAERTVEDMKKAEYMKSFIGEVFPATVSNVTGFGIFASLENTVEGLIRFSDLTDDYYIYDDAKKQIAGQQSGKVYKPGDNIKIQVLRADEMSGRIDFGIYREESILSKKQRTDKEKNKTKIKCAKYLKKRRKKR